MFYVVPVWPLCAIAGGLLLYKLLKKVMFENDNRAGEKSSGNDMRKIYAAGTALSFLRKFY